MMTDPGHRREIYVLSPKEISPETIAVTFAKTSRSPLSFREIAAELTEAKSQAFHEKWVVGYGHASVAEHAVLHIAFENVSRLAIECIESNRLASYTEKSTRYQRWDPEGFHVPEEVLGGAYESLYLDCCQALFRTYHKTLQPVRDVVQSRYPRQGEESEERWDGRIRSKYVDVCRFLLPSAALANVGMTINARALEHAIQKMLSDPLEEVRTIGETVKRAALEETPTLVKYADRNPYMAAVRDKFSEWADSLEAAGDRPSVRLVNYDERGEVHILAALLYRASNISFEEALGFVQGKSTDERRELALQLFADRDRFDVPPRELEHTTYSFDIVLDQGAYFELKRHRMMTQSPQPLTSELGYAVPKLIVKAGVEAPYREAMEYAADAYRTLAEWNPYVAAYVVPNGFNRGVLLTLNLREVYHFCELRAQANAHFSIRRIALGMAEEIKRIHPLLAAHLRLPEGEGAVSIEEANFHQV
jgi:thymidylate synthase ThyX